VYLILDGEVTKHSLEHWHPKDLQGKKKKDTNFGSDWSKFDIKKSKSSLKPKVNLS